MDRYRLCYLWSSHLALEGGETGAPSSLTHWMDPHRRTREATPASAPSAESPAESTAPRWGASPRTPPSAGSRERTGSKPLRGRGHSCFPECRSTCAPQVLHPPSSPGREHHGCEFGPPAGRRERSRGGVLTVPSGWQESASYPTDFWPAQPHAGTTLTLSSAATAKAATTTTRGGISATAQPSTTRAHCSSSPPPAAGAPQTRGGGRAAAAASIEEAAQPQGGWAPGAAARQLPLPLVPLHLSRLVAQPAAGLVLAGGLPTVG